MSDNIFRQFHPRSGRQTDHDADLHVEEGDVPVLRIGQRGEGTDESEHDDVHSVHHGKADTGEGDAENG